MAREIINVGATPNDGLGDPIRTAFTKTNNNFGELYSRVQISPPTTSVGALGDVKGMTAYDSEYYYYCFADFDGSSIIWREVPNALIANVAELSATGNITSDSYYIGDGSLLTGVIAAAPTALINGTTDITTAPSGNANISIDGTSNVAVFTSAGLDVTGEISATGNVIGGNFGLGGTLSLGGTITGNIIPSANVIYSLGNTTNRFSDLWIANSSIYMGTTTIATTGTALTVNGANVLIGNVGDPFSTTGNITGGNIISLAAISSSGTISAGGNVAGLFILGDGGFLSNVTATGNVAVTQIQDGTTLIRIDGPGGNIVMDVDGTANLMMFKPEGLELTGNANITGNVNSANAYLTGRFIAVGNITGGNVTTGGLIVSTANVQGTNVNAGQQMSAVGNITGGNITTAGLLSATGNIIGGNIVTVGNVTADTLTTTNSVINAEISTSGNVTGANLITSGLVSVTGNITGGNVAAVGIFSGPTANISGNVNTGNVNASLLSATGNVNSANAYITGRVLAVGNVTGGNVTSSGLIVTTGNVTGGNVLSTAIVSATGAITGGSIGTAGAITGASVSASGAITGSSLTVGVGTITGGNIVNSNANGIGNIGSTTKYFNTVFAKATSAQYADLAENYLADADYEPGTVLEFGGTAEVTLSTDGTIRVAGIVSTNPAHLMNSHLTGQHVVALALIGRVPCKVRGTISKGDMLVAGGDGYARPTQGPIMGSVIGKSLEESTGDNIIEVVVGRL